MADPELLYETDGPVAVVTFNRPQARNAMTWAMYDGLREACDRVDADPDVRVMILRGAGGAAFVAGTDIGQFRDFHTPEDALAYERRLDGVMDRLEAVTLPTIAAIEGYAVGGGAAIAVACDFRYCTPESQIGVPIARTLGNCLSMANTARLVELLGPARTKDLIYRARLVGGEEALRAGLVNEVVPAAELLTRAEAILRQVFAQAPLAVKFSLEAVNKGMETSQAEGMALEASLFGLCAGTEDKQEGTRAFLQKRPPQFQGR